MTVRRWNEAFVTSLVFLGSAVIFGLLGLSNLSDALTYGGRFVGAVLVAAALFLAVSTYAVWDDCHRRKLDASGSIALMGAFVAFVGALLLFLTAVASGDLYSRTFWVRASRWGLTSMYPLWLTLLVVSSGLILFLALRRQAKLPSPKQVGIAALITAALTAANFGYTQLYQPSAQPPLTTVSAELGEAVRAVDGSGTVLTLNIAIKNQGEVDVYLLGGVYAIYGRKAKVVQDVENWPRRLTNLQHGEAVSSQTDWYGYDLIQTDSWFPFGGWLNRATEGNVRKVVRIVNPEAYDELAVRADVVVSRKDRMHVDLMKEEVAWIGEDGRPYPPNFDDPGTHVLRHRYAVHEGNKVLDVIRLRRFLDLYWIVGIDPDSGAIESSLYCSIFPVGIEFEEIGRILDNPDSSLNMDERQMYDRYGLQMVSTWWTQESLLDMPAAG